MGHGASTSKYDGVCDVFCNVELSAGGKMMSSDDNLSASFVDFVKSGLWVDSLMHIFPCSQSTDPAVSHAERLAKEHISLYGYRVQRGKEFDFEGMFSGDVSTSINRCSRRTNSSISTVSSPRVSPQVEVYLESYPNIENCAAFVPEQLMKIMFAAVYPIYLASPEHQRFLKFGWERGEIEGETAVTPHTEKMQHTSKQAKRAQELLLGCAAYFDESILLDELQEASWPTIVSQAFDSCPLCITIVDTSQAHFPIVYANTAFSALTKPQVLGESLDILNGEETEPSQLALLHEALRSRSSTKLAITHYSKKDKPFIDLVAMLPIGSYMAVVHFPATRLGHLDDLKMVDDVLVLMQLVIKPPHTAAPAPPAGSPGGAGASVSYASQKWRSARSYVSSKHKKAVHPVHPVHPVHQSTQTPVDGNCVALPKRVALSLQPPTEGSP